MEFKYQIISCLIIIIILGVLIFFQLNEKKFKNDKLYILCTTTIIADAVKNIAKDTVSIITLMGPGIDPHLYKAVESDIGKIISADIIFYNGLHLEARLTNLFEQLEKRQTTIAISQSIPKSMLLLNSKSSELYDPHIWFDINLWIQVVQTICQALIKKNPKNKDFYEHNTQIYKKELKTLLKKTHKIMSRIPNNKKVIITGHDAFSYFGRVYNCKVIGLQGISTESSPGAYDLQKIITLICKQDIPAIFAESSIPIKNIQAIQEGVTAHHKKVILGGEIFSDALGSKNSDGDTYIKMILHNTQTIALALSC